MTDVIEAIDAVKNEVEQLRQLYQETINGVNTKGSYRGEELMAFIRSQPNCLSEPWRTPYLMTARLVLTLMHYEGRIQESIVLGEQLLSEIGMDDSVQFMLICNTMGVNYLFIGDYEKSLEYMHLAHAKNVALQSDPNKDVPVREGLLTIGNIGFLYTRMNQPEKAVEWGLRAYAIAEEHHLLRELQTMSSIVCKAYLDLEQYEKGIEYGEKGIEILEAHQQGRDGYIYNHVADAWLGLSELELAEAYHRKGLEYSQSIESDAGDTVALIGLSRVALKQNKNNQAISLLKEALQITESHGFLIETYEIYRSLSDVYEQMGNREEALAYHKQFHTAYTAVYDQKKQETVHQLEVKHRTEIAQIEARQLRIENEALEKMVAERTADVLKALEQSERANAVRSNMLKTIMHEFRTPLTVINGSAQMLDQFHAQLTDEKRNKHYANITQSIQTLTHLLDNVNAVENSSTGNLAPTFKTVEVGAWSQKLVNHLRRKTADLDNVTYIFDAADETLIKIDKKMTKAIVRELLINAIKYTPDDKPITVEVGVDKAELVITVADEGVGIAADELDNIFELFYRAYKAGDIPGLGTGLYVVRAMVTALNGEIDVQSSRRGTTFTLKLPTPSILENR